MTKPAVHRDSFVVRIWWEPGPSQPGDRRLWRGEVQHPASGEHLMFQSLDELENFIQTYTGALKTDHVHVPHNTRQ